jgi:hypothetical protein
MDTQICHVRCTKKKEERRGGGGVREGNLIVLKLSLNESRLLLRVRMKVCQGTLFVAIEPANDGTIRSHGGRKLLADVESVCIR